MEQEAKVATKPERSKKGRVLILSVAGAMAVLGLLLGWLFILPEMGLIPGKYRRGIDVTLYFPARLPEGYHVNKSSFKREGDVLIFSIDAPKGRNIAVSEQAAPNGVVRKPASPIQPSSAEKDFVTSIGQAHVGLWGDKFVTDIATSEGAWIILNTTGFTADEATAVANSFVKL